MRTKITAVTAGQSSSIMNAKAGNSHSPDYDWFRDGSRESGLHSGHARPILPTT
jgi:hypothetical protein